MNRRHFSIILVSAALAAGCTDTDPPYMILPAPIDPVKVNAVAPMDVAGTWFSKAVNNAVNCGTGEILDAKTFVISQDLNDIEMLVSSGDVYTGTVSGDIVEWAGSYDERGGTANFTSATAVFSANAGTADAAWTWSNGSDSCNGTMSITFEKGIALGESDNNSNPGVADPFTFVDNAAFFEGSVGIGRDRDDVFAFVAEADGVVQAELSHFDVTASDLELRMLDEDLNEIAISANPDMFEKVEASVAAGGTYYILVESRLLTQPEIYYLSVDFND